MKTTTSKPATAKTQARTKQASTQTTGPCYDWRQDCYGDDDFLRMSWEAMQDSRGWR